jgi:hypothetical protein
MTAHGKEDTFRCNSFLSVGLFNLFVGLILDLVVLMPLAITPKTAQGGVRRSAVRLSVDTRESYACAVCSLSSVRVWYGLRSHAC